MRHTIHELRVHQIELELQNEELRRAHAELDAARMRYFDLYDLAPVGYLTVSKQGLLLDANLTSATLLGSTRGVLVMQLLSQFILPEDQDHAETPNLPRGNGETILVVDDEENIRDITERILSRSGYRVLSGANGIEAKSLYEQNRAAISLVLADYMMPNLDGLQLARSLHRMNPEVRIILSSGVTEALTDDIIAEFQTNGVVGQITKPYTVDILLNMLYDILHPQQRADKERYAAC